MPSLLRRRASAPAGRRHGPNHRRRTELGLLIFGSVIVVATYVLASVATNAKIPTNLGALLGVILGLSLLAHIANRFLAPDANPVLLPLAALLNGLGYVMIARINDPNAHPGLQAVWTAVGVGAYIFTLLLIRRSRDLDRYRYLLLLGGVALMLAPLIPHFGEDINGARLWIHLGPVNGQPVELAKLALCIFFASYFSEKQEMLSVPTMRIGNRLVLDPRPLGPIIVAWGFAMVVLGAERDIGFTLLIFVLFMVMLWLAAGRWQYLVLGLVLFAVGAFVASHLFTQVHGRVTTWVNFWEHPLQDITKNSYQFYEGLYGFGSGGLVGTGLGFGLLGYIPIVSSDYIFSAFAEEMGLLGTTAIVFAFVLMVGAGLFIAQRARSDFARLAAAGFTLILGLQAFIVMAGIVGLLPFTGITLPFMAYGGSSLVANYVLIALLMRISDEGERATFATQATATPLRSDDPGSVVRA